MKEKIFVLFFLIIITNVFPQKDTLNVNNSYWEDQLYIHVTYNILNNQPDDFPSSDFSYGLSFGYIKDIPLNKQNTFALGIGLGYNYDQFTHGFKIDNTNNFVIDESFSNKIKNHNIEMPLQIRWRTSDAVTYSFWRIYTGLRLSYNVSNQFISDNDAESFVFKNIDNYNKFQTGLELSIGYGAFNLYTYYGVSPMFKNALYSSKTIETAILKVGLIFYLL